MIKVRASTITLGVILILMLTLLMSLREELLVAHFDETIHYFSSDAATYMSLFDTVYANISLGESHALFLIGSPILFMKLSDGNLFTIQACNLMLMGFTLKVAMNSFATRQGRIVFIAGACVMPYFIFGFLSLNKEIYAMCSAIFFASYVVRGMLRHLLIALLLAFCARYYMLLALVALLALVPRTGNQRNYLIITLLIVISATAPILKYAVPEYSNEGLLDATGTTGLIFSKAVDSGGYAVIYPLKYMMLVPQRAYSFLIDSSRAGNGMEAIVSLVSLAVILTSIYTIKFKHSIAPPARILIIMGFVAPIPIMWTEIMHWRYFSFVYFFFLYALILHYIDGPRTNRQVKFQKHG